MTIARAILTFSFMVSVILIDCRERVPLALVLPPQCSDAGHALACPASRARLPALAFWWGRQSCLQAAFQAAIDSERTTQAVRIHFSGFMPASVVTSKPAIEGHFKTGQRTASRTELVVPRQ